MNETPTPPNGIPIPVSPTGTAIIPAKLVPYILGVIAVMGALIGLDTTIPALAKASPYLQAAVAILTVLLGLTPGLRKAAAIVLVLALPLGSLTACHPTEAQKAQMIECAGKIKDGVISHSAEILLAAAEQDWARALEQLLAAAGPGILCEAQALLDQIRTQPTAMMLISPGESESKAQRIQTWLKTHAKDYR